MKWLYFIIMIVQYTHFIYYMQKITKAINSDSLRPSIKPILTHKSDNFDYMRPSLSANGSEKHNYGKFDSIK